ncbi:MAG: SsrA-binding protein SmpB [Patescibacteria group bacterium]
MKTIIYNKRAKFDYEILETFEAGIVLVGHEVKSAKNGNVSLKGAYVVIQQTGPKGTPEAWILNMHIGVYKQAGKIPNYNPTRSRKLLLHKKEINYLIGKQRQKGLTLVPISIYTKKSRLKLEFGLGRGKRKIDKREKIKEREFERRKQRILKGKI